MSVVRWDPVAKRLLCPLCGLWSRSCVPCDHAPGCEYAGLPNAEDARRRVAMFESGIARLVRIYGALDRVPDASRRRLGMRCFNPLRGQWGRVAWGGWDA